jgi:hypothetical protein
MRGLAALGVLVALACVFAGSRFSRASRADEDASADAKAKPAASPVVALPLGGRVKMDPWSDKLEMLKAKPVGTVAEREKMPFEVTPFMLYLTRLANANSSAVAPSGAISADSKAAADVAGKPPKK